MAIVMASSAYRFAMVTHLCFRVKDRSPKQNFEDLTIFPFLEKKIPFVMSLAHTDITNVNIFYKCFFLRADFGSKIKLNFYQRI